MPLTTFIEFQGLQGNQAGRPQYAAVWSLGLLLRMLDESLTLKGTITTATDRVSEVTKVTLPISLTATKSFINDTAIP